MEPSLPSFNCIEVDGFWICEPTQKNNETSEEEGRLIPLSFGGESGSQDSLISLESQQTDKVPLPDGKSLLKSLIQRHSFMTRDGQER